MNAGALSTRFDIARQVAAGAMPSIPVEAWPAWRTLAAEPFDEQVSGVVRELLNGRVSAGTLAVLRGLHPISDAESNPSTREHSLRQLITLALSSPELQRR